jgi:hypothetical protein
MANVDEAEGALHTNSMKRCPESITRKLMPSASSLFLSMSPRHGALTTNM